MPSCIICNKEEAKVCQGCHSASYCSKQCQTKDYRTDKLLCSRFKEYQDRPEEHQRRGIIFPECEKSPLWVWIETESKDGYQSLVLDDHLTTSSNDAKKVLFLDIQHSQSRRRALDDTPVIGYCDKKVRGDSSPNRSIQVVAKGATTSPWYGPVLVMKKMGLETNIGAYGDIYLTDYSDAIDSLRYDYLPGKSAVSQGGSNIRSLYSARTVQGVIISCSGDIKVLGADQFIPVAVWIFDPVFVADKSTSSEMLGVPVGVRKLPPHLPY